MINGLREIIQKTSVVLSMVLKLMCFSQPIHLSVYPSIHPCIHLSVYPSI